jgi:tetratricopeptide (TPR) repeat protein
MAYQSEIEKLEQRFREKPEQWFAALADAYRKAGDLDMALEVLNAWIDKRPNYTSGHIVLGRCLLDKEQHASAARAFETVLQLDVENIIALKSLSEIAEHEGDVDGARRWLEQLLDVDPMNEDAQAALEKLGAPAEAEVAPAVPVEHPPEPVAFEMAEEEAPDEVPFGLVRTAESEVPDAEDVVPEDGVPEDVVPEAPEVETAPPPSGFEPYGAGLELVDDEPAVESVEGLAPAEEPGAWVTDEPIPHDQGATAFEIGGAEEEEVAAEESAVAEAVPADEAPVVEPPEAAEAAALDEAFRAFEPPVPRVTGDEEVVFVEEPEAPETPPDVWVAPEPPAAEEIREELPLIMPDQVTGDAAEATEEEAGRLEPVVTETMAELYAKQGLYREARNVYASLLAERPGDPRLTARLAELAEKEPRGVPAVDSKKSDRFAAAATGGLSVRMLLRELAAARPGATAEPTQAEVAGRTPDSSPEPAAAPIPEDVDEARRGFSFDEFFGGGQEPSADETTETPQESEGPDDDSQDEFRSWLKGLKT